MKYTVTMPIICNVYIEVEAESEEEAIELAHEEYGVSNFCGNGGSDKLIGVYESNHSIDVDSEPFEGKIELKITVTPS